MENQTKGYKNKDKTIMSRLRNSNIPKYLTIAGLTLATTLASPSVEINKNESELEQMVNVETKTTQARDRYFKEQRIENSIYDDLILQPHEHKTPKGKDIYDKNDMTDYYQMQADRKKYMAIRRFDLNPPNVETRYLKDGDDIYMIAEKFNDTLQKTNTAVKYLGGFSAFETDFVNSINKVKLSSISFNYSLGKGTEETPEEYEILYDLPKSEVGNISGVKNPIVFAYTMRELQEQNLDYYDEKRQRLFSNSSLEEIVDKIDEGYGDQPSSNLNKTYETNPANPLAKAKVYMTMALNETWDAEKDERMQYVEKAWDLVDESEELFNKEDSEFYNYIKDTYGEEGVHQFNRQMLITYTTALMPTWYSRSGFEKEELEIVEKRDEFLIPLVESLYSKENERKELYDRMNEIL